MDQQFNKCFIRVTFKKTLGIIVTSKFNRTIVALRACCEYVCDMLTLNMDGQ